MALKTYCGSCHCAAVRFEADIDFEKGSARCNCSLCRKARAWFVLVAPDQFRLTRGTEAQSTYEWTPPGHPTSNLHYHFCSTCGVRTVGRGDQGPGGGPFYFVAVASLDDVDWNELTSAPIRYLDGLHDRYDRAPENPQLM